MDGSIQNVSNILNRWPLHNKWMAPYRMFYHTYYMDGPIQNDFPYVLNGWPHTE